MLVALAALASCGKSSEARKADTAAEAEGGGEPQAAAPEPEVEKLPTALPEARPSPFEAEYHVGTPDNGDLVSVKLTEKGATTSMGDREHRLVIGFDVAPADLDRVYAGLRDAAFDRIETHPSREAQPSGTSIRLVAGTIRHQVADFGNVFPKDEWATEYDAAAKALEPHLPAAAKDAKTQIEVRWDASMKGHRATVALALGADFAGVTRVKGTSADHRVGLRGAGEPGRKIIATLRSGPPATSTDVELDPAVHAGVEVVFDAETSRPIARAFASGDAPAAPPAAPSKPKSPAPSASPP
jgi:hypothetical protein